jgi:hypothetical protein
MLQGIGAGVKGAAAIFSEVGDAKIAAVYQRTVALVHAGGSVAVGDIVHRIGLGKNVVKECLFTRTPEFGLIAAGQYQVQAAGRKALL